MRAWIAAIFLVLLVPEAHAEPDPIVASDWLTARGATLPRDGVDGDSCEETTVGPAREAALACDVLQEGGRYEPPGFWMSTHRVFRVVRAGKIVTVLDVQKMLQGFDSGWPRLVLQIELSADGKKVVVEDRGVVSGGPLAQRGPEESCTPKPGGDFIRRLCAGRGTYQWRGGRYVRARTRS